MAEIKIPIHTHPPAVRTKFPGWKPGALDHLQGYLVSRYFRASLQLASGQFIILLFVFIQPITFSAACLASIFFFIGIILRQDQHVASFLISATKTAGCLFAGATIAGIVLEFAHLPGVGFPGFLCLFTVLGTLLLSTVRATADVGTGLISCVVFSITLIQSEFAWPSRVLWAQGIVPFYYAGLVTALAEIFAGSIVLPSLARKDLRMTSSQLIRGIGHSLSAYATHVLRPESPHGQFNAQIRQPKSAEPDPAKPKSPVSQYGVLLWKDQNGSEVRPGRGGSAEVSQVGSRRCLKTQLRVDSDADDSSEDYYWTYLEEISKPEGSLEPAVTPSLASHRPLIAAARRLVGEAAHEPPWTDNCSMDLDKWSNVVDSFRKLALRSAALESLLEGPEQVVVATEIRHLLGVEVMPIFGLLFAQMAASCANMANALKDAADGKQKQAHMRLLLEPSYATLEFELASVLHCVVNAYWRRVQPLASAGGTHFRPEVQIRVVLYLGALCSGILETLAEAEKAAIAAVACPSSTKKKRLLPLLSSSKRRRKEDQDDMHMKAAMSHKKAIDSSLRRILTSLSVHQGAGDSQKENGQSGVRPSLYEGTSQRPLQLRPSNHLTTVSMSAAASDSLEKDGSMQHPGSLSAQDDHTEDSDRLTSQHEGIQHSDTSSQQMMSAETAQDSRSTGEQPAVATNGPAAQDIATSDAAESGEADQKNEQGTGDKKPIPKCYSVDGFLNKLLLTRRPSAVHDPVRRKAVVAASALQSHQLTEQIGSELGLPLPSESGREEFLQASAAAPGLIMPADAQQPLVEQALQHPHPGRTAADSDDELDDLLALKLQPSETFLRNWNQHTSFHRRQQQAQEKAGDEEDADSFVSDAESFESLSLNSNADQCQDSSRKAATADVKEEARQPVTGTSCDNSRRATGSRTKMLGKVKAVPGLPGAKALWKGVKEAFGWLWPLLVLMSGYAVWEAAFLAYTQTVPQALKSLKDLRWWRKNRQLQFFFKFFGTAATMLCGILVGSYYSPAFHSWVPLYAMTTVAVVLSEKIDTTVSKGVLRVAGTAIGGTLGFLVMLRSGLATNPYALVAIVCTVTALVAPVTLTVYKYAVFLMLITFDSLILCQYSPTPGSTGSTLRYYARVVDITLGVIIVLAIELILPWYTSVASLETLGLAYKQATELVGHYYDAFHNETKLATDPNALAEEKAGVEALEKDLLIKKVAQPLSDVQVSLDRETVLWKRGLLVMPTIVNDTLSGLQVLQDRLAAVELMLMQRPIVSGYYTGHAYKNFLLPLDKGFRKVCARALELGSIVEEVLSEEAEPKHLLQLQTAIDNLQNARVKLRKQYVQRQHEFVFALHRATEPHLVDRTPDDALRYQSVMFALIRALDKCVLVARMVLEDEFIVSHITAGRWEHRRLWLGLPRDKPVEKAQKRARKRGAAAQAAKDVNAERV
ncbi:hypothetical protein COCOBI_14-2470 [Coccomyxa sp. Obi]|nr:hypothetical protein COCOBI_14-2470 [Coccomyxa sp. Obi]